MTPLILASASPRRRTLLEEAGYTVNIAPPDIDETARPGEAPATLVERLAREKAQAIVASAEAIVVAGDTIVALDGEILGKPSDASDAVDMLTRLSRSKHEVISGWCVRRGAAELSGAEITTVTFRAITQAEIEAYVATGEPLDKAGAYGIQEGGGAFVSSVEGSLENVIGLPVAVVVAAIERLASATDG